MKNMRLSVRFRSGLAILGLVALMGAGAGCDQADGTADPLDGAIVSAGGESLDEALPAGPFASLTIEQIDARVKMTPEQRSAIQNALDKARAARDERQSRAGRGAWGRRSGADRPRLGPAAGDPPAFVFLEEASRTLSSDQFAQLARLLGEERDRWVAERPAWGAPGAGGPRGHGRGAGGRHGAGFARGARPADGSGPGPEFAGLLDRAAGALDLTGAQRERVAAILDERAVEMREIRSRVASGSATPEMARDEIHALRTGTRDELKSVLTAEQWEKADAFRSQRVGQQIDARMERMESQLERRGEFLKRVLDLEPGQAARVNDLLRETIPARKETLSGVKAGTILPEDAAMRVLELERSTAEQIGSLLTPEQRVRWEAVKDLLPRGGPRRGF